MKIQSLFVLSIICFFCMGAFAESGEVATGLCKDGSTYTGSSKKGACRGHKGLKEWFADKETESASTAAKAAPTAAPAATTATSGTATGLCKDGTEYTGESKRGACRGHKGVKEWYADKETESAPAAAKAAPIAAPAATTATSGTATGLCKDGTEYTGESKRGACRGHKGIKEWYADKEAVPAEKAAAPATVAPATAPSGTTTGLCKDGTEYTGEAKRGACRGHKGLKEWYGDKVTEESESEIAASAAAAPAPAAEKEKAAPATPSAKVAQPAPAAGSGQVWVNTRSKIYHCEGSKFYGNTKEGEYMSEADAQAKGFNANRKKVCN